MPIIIQSFTKQKVVAIGASTGGVAALEHIFSGLPKAIPPMLLVIHMPVGFTSLLSARFNDMFNFSVKEAQTGDFLTQGQLLIAPSGRHMKLVLDEKRHAVECFVGPKVHHVIPSVDVLFDSVADVMQDKAIGVILTGMGADGADGLLKMRGKGAATIGQDRETCAIYGMSKVAKEMGAVTHELPLHQIAKKIMTLS